MTRHGQFDRFFALLAKMPGADKEELVWNFSGMLTTSLREFYEKNPEGYKRMIATMQLEVHKNSIPPDIRDLKRLRSAVLTRIQQHGVDTTNWQRVNQFLQQPRIAGKRLYEMDEKALMALIHKLEMILKKDAEKRHQEIELAQKN